MLGDSSCAVVIVVVADVVGGVVGAGVGGAGSCVYTSYLRIVLLYSVECLCVYEVIVGFCSVQ